MRDTNAPSRFASLTNMLSAEKPVVEQQPEKLLEPTMVNETKDDTKEVEVSLDTKLVSYIARECDFDKDPSALYSCIQKRDWDATIKRAEEAPIEAMTWVSRKEKDGRLRWRLLPLHSAVIFKAPERVVEALLCAYPKGAQCKDDQGMLPIHLAFRHGNSEDVVNLLLVAYPQSIDVKDRKGRIPLELAQASASPNKDAFIRALERGPTYYAVAAAATERAAVTAEQRAIFDAKLIEVKNTHKHEMAALTREYEAQKQDMGEQLNYLEEELAKTQETSQVLVDHVSSLEAQLASRSDTERFLATKIATLDSSLKETKVSKETVEKELRAELNRITTKNKELQERLEFVTNEETEGKSKFHETESKLSELVAEYEKKNLKQAETIQHLEADLINARVTTTNLESQLKNKVIVEQTLATQVSTLASRLAESAADTSNATNVYAHRVELLEKERSNLRMTVKDLTNKLANVAQCLDAMTVEQECIVKAAADHEKTMTEAAQVHSEILADARRQQELFEEAQKERDEIANILKRQEEDLSNTKEEREKLMEKVVAMDAQMESSHKDREDLVCSVVRQRLEMRDLIKNALAVVPKDVTDEEEIIDAVVKTTMKARAEREAKSAEESDAAKAPKKESTTEDEESKKEKPAETKEAVVKEESAETKKVAKEEPVSTAQIFKEEPAAKTNPPPSPKAPTEEKSDAPKEKNVPATDENDSQTESHSGDSVASKATAGTAELSADDEPVEELNFRPRPQTSEDRVLASRSFG